MTILNPSFETEGATLGQADSWTWSVDTTGTAIVFSDINSEFEDFAWESFDDTLSSIPARFTNGDVYDSFHWVDYFQTWGSNWINSFEDDFVWVVFDDHYIPAFFTGYDQFDWTSFNPVLTSVPAVFNFGTGDDTIYESFELHW